MWWLAAIGLGLQLFGMYQQNEADKQEEESTRAGGARAQEAAEFQAVQLERKAGEERAIGSREISEQSKEGRLIKSRAKALGAASGAGGYEGTLDDIDAEAEYRMLTAFYNSETSARDLEVAASVSRREGADAARAYEASAAGSRARNRANMIQSAGGVLQSGASLYERYGQ